MDTTAASSPTAARLHGLLALARLVREERPLAEILDDMAAVVGHALGFATVAVNVRRALTDDLVVAAVHGRDDVRATLLGQESRWSEWDAVTAAAPATAGVHFVRAGEHDWRRAGPVSFVPPPTSGTGDDHWQPEDALIAPLVGRRDRVLGFLSLDEPRDGLRPGLADLEVLGALASGVAAAIEATHAGERDRMQSAALRRLAQVAAGALATTDAPAVLAEVARGAGATLGLGEIEVARSEGGRLRSVTTIGDRTLLDGLATDPIDHLAREHARHEDVAVLGPGLAWPEDPLPAGRLGEGPRAWRGEHLLVVLRGADGRPAGAVRASAPDDGLTRGRRELELLRMFAEQARAVLTSAAHAATRASEARKAAMLAGSLDAILTVDHEGRILEFNPASERTFGIAREEVLGRDMADVVIPPEAREHHRAGMRRWATAGGPSRIVGRRVEVVAQRADGERFPAEIAVVPIETEGRPLFSAYLRDITERKAAERELAEQRDSASHAANHDELTGLPNHRAALAHLEGALAAGTVSVVHVSVASFGLVGDSFGFAARQTLAEAVAERLRGLDVEVAARLAGGEFALAVAGLDQAGATALGERVVAELARPVTIADVDVTLTLHTGVATQTGGSAGELLRCAEVAAGHAARTHAAVAAYAAHADDAGRRLRTLSGLARAVEREELELHFQPLVTLGERRLLGLEALVRWRPGGGDLVGPDVFIPLAEASGLIEPIGAWVVDAACRQVRAWTDAGLQPPVVGVNVSPRQMLRTDVPAVIAAALAAHGLAPDRLCVEVTESAVLADPDRMRAALHALTAMGVRCALDDFGCEESSLARLAELPVAMLKIDRSFLTGIPGDDRAERLLRAIVGLADALELRTVVEGVETRAQLAHAAQLGATLAQGYLLGRPEPAAAVARLLAPADALSVPLAA